MSGPKTRIKIASGGLALVHYVHGKDELYAEGIIGEGSYYPWKLCLDVQTSAKGIDFLGPLVAISQIENTRGEIVYLNENLPSAYGPFDPMFPKRVEEINTLRREQFGEGFDY